MKEIGPATYTGGTVVYGPDGTARGRYWSDEPLLGRHVGYIQNFLCQISKRVGVEMSKTDKTNMAFIAGEIKTLKLRDDGGGLILVDVGENSKYIPCTVYDDKELAAILGRFREGDVIQLQGFVRAWSQKKDGVWKNSIDVRITHIKNKPPARPESSPAKQTDEFPEWV